MTLSQSGNPNVAIVTFLGVLAGIASQRAVCAGCSCWCATTLAQMAQDVNVAAPSAASCLR